MTPNKEDYLKIIFELGGDTTKISNKQIVAGLDVSAASVTEMVSKLVSQHFVTHTPYQGIKLTAEGRRQAALLVRNHRLWEVFLVNELGYQEDAVHSDAERLEHATTPEMADRLARRLGNPRTCPHGGVIPDAAGHYAQQSRESLADLSLGEKATLERVVDEAALIDYLSAIGLKIGDYFTVVEKDADVIVLETESEKIPVVLSRAAHMFVAG